MGTNMVQEKKMLDTETLPIPWKLNSPRATCENGEVVLEIAPAFCSSSLELGWGEETKEETLKTLTMASLSFLKLYSKFTLCPINVYSSYV